jgi:hypothetical protein
MLRGVAYERLGVGLWLLEQRGRLRNDISRWLVSARHEHSSDNKYTASAEFTSIMCLHRRDR